MYFVTGVSTPTTSVSWKPLLPVMLWATCPVIATTGEESAKAVAIPVTRSVAPGPDVAEQTPAFLETLPYASAMWAPSCSCLTRTCLILESQSAS